MFADFKPEIRGLILDMDGVLWKEVAPIGDLPAIFERIHGLGLNVTLATNNATLAVEEYLRKLHGFGVSLAAEQILTSSQALTHILEERFPDKGAVFVVGENGVISALCEAGFTPITDAENETPVVAVVSSLDRAVTYGKLRRAALHVRAGIPFFATNHDPTLPSPLGLVPGAGAILAALETATGVEATVFGKPARFMFDLAARRMNLIPSEILVVGDRFETDIVGGQAIGARTALVLSGVTSSAAGHGWKQPPDLIAADLGKLVGA